MPREFRTVRHSRLDARPRRTARAAPPDGEDKSPSGIDVPMFYRHRPQLIGESLRFLANGVQSGTIKASVTTMLPLSRTAGAHRMLEGRRAQGVIVLDPRR